MNTETVGTFEARLHFSRLLEKAHKGSVIILTRRGKPVAKLGPAADHPAHPVFGSAKGKIHVAQDFDEPLEDMADYQ